MTSIKIESDMIGNLSFRVVIQGCVLLFDLKDEDTIPMLRCFLSDMFYHMDSSEYAKVIEEEYNSLKEGGWLNATVKITRYNEIHN